MNFFRKLFSQSKSAPGSSSSAEGLSLFPLTDWRAPAALSGIPGSCNAQAVCETLSRLFQQMHRFRMRRETAPMSVYFTPDAWQAYADRIAADQQRHVIAHADHIAVLDCVPQGSYQAGGVTHVVCKVRTRMVNWLESDQTWKCVGGDPRAEHFSDVYFDLAPSGQSGQTPVPAACPCCGALNDMLANAQCPFCDHVSAMGVGAWVIAAAQERGRTP